MPEPIYDEELLAELANDTTTYSEDEFDADADHAAPPPPLPDGWYQADLKLEGIKDNEGNLKEARKQKWGAVPETFFTQISAKIVDPDGPENGKLTSRYNVTTHPEPLNHNTSTANLVYQAVAGKNLPKDALGRYKPGDHMALVLDELRGQTPRVWIRTQLEGQAEEASKSFNDRKKAGQLQPGEKAPKTFRKEVSFKMKWLDEDGNPVNGEEVTGMTWDPVAKEIVTGRPQIVNIKPLSFTPPSK